MTLHSLEELENDLRKNGLRPIYLVTGPEQYLCRLALHMLKEKAVVPGSEVFDYFEFSAGDASIDEIVEGASTFPMLSERKVVLVRETEKLKDSEQGALLDSLSILPPRSVMILSASELDQRKKCYKTLRDRACIVVFPKLKGAALEHWAESYVRSQGYRISPPAAKRVIDLIGSDLQTLASELEKLLLYSGKDKTISGEAIEGLVQSSRQHGIFELVGAVGRHDRNGALRSLSNLLGAGEHPLMVVTMLARHCRQILIVKDLLLRRIKAPEIARAAQIPVFILDQFLKQARAADTVEVQDMYIRLAEIDRKLKSSSGEGRLLLDALICALV